MEMPGGGGDDDSDAGGDRVATAVKDASSHLLHGHGSGAVGYGSTGGGTGTGSLAATPLAPPPQGQTATPFSGAPNPGPQSPVGLSQVGKDGEFVITIDPLITASSGPSATSPAAISPAPPAAISPAPPAAGSQPEEESRKSKASAKNEANAPYRPPRMRPESMENDHVRLSQRGMSVNKSAKSHPTRANHDLNTVAQWFRAINDDNVRARKESLHRSEAEFEQKLNTLKSAVALSEDELQHEWDKLLSRVEAFKAEEDRAMEENRLSKVKLRMDKEENEQKVKLSELRADRLEDELKFKKAELEQHKREAAAKVRINAATVAMDEIRRQEESLTASLLQESSDRREPQKKRDDIWNRRQIILAFSLSAGLSVLLQTYHLISPDHISSIAFGFGAIWLVGYLAFHIGLFGTTKKEKDFSRHSMHAVYLALSAYVVYTFYLISKPTLSESLAPSPSSESLPPSHAPSTKDDTENALYFFVMWAIFACGLIFAWCRGCLTGGDEDTDD